MLGRRPRAAVRKGRAQAFYELRFFVIVKRTRAWTTQEPARRGMSTVLKGGSQARQERSKMPALWCSERIPDPDRPKDIGWSSYNSAAKAPASSSSSVYLYDFSGCIEMSLVSKLNHSGGLSRLYFTVLVAAIYFSDFELALLLKGHRNLGWFIDGPNETGTEIEDEAVVWNDSKLVNRIRIVPTKTLLSNFLSAMDSPESLQSIDVTLGLCRSTLKLGQQLKLPTAAELN